MVPSASLHVHTAKRILLELGAGGREQCEPILNWKSYDKKDKDSISVRDMTAGMFQIPISKYHVLKQENAGQYNN